GIGAASLVASIAHHRRASRILRLAGLCWLSTSVRPSPLAQHGVAYILRVAERRRSTGSRMGAASAAARAVPRQVVRAGAWMPGRLIGGDAFVDYLLAGLCVR